jgi:ParB family chromosome partitioning protein
MQLIKMKVKDLLKTVAKYNPRTITNDAMDRLKHSLNTYGQVENLILNIKTNTLVSGHQRLEAAKQLGWTDMDVVVVELSEAQERALNITMNNRNLQGDWSLPMLKESLDFITEHELNIEDTGFTLTDYEDFGFSDMPIEEVEAGEPPEEPKTKLGDIYILDGKHRVVCGDSTKREDVERLMDGKKADMVFTSPPYCRGKSGFEDKGKYENDEDNNLDKWKLLMDDFFKLWKEQSKYLFINLQMLSSNKEGLISWLYLVREHLVDICILIKSPLPAMEKNVFNSDYEFLIILMGTSHPTRHIKISKEFRGTQSNVYLMKRSSGKFSKILRATFDISLPSHYIQILTNESDLICDPFGGSGTTLIACEQLGRTCYTCDIEPKYVDVIIDRYKKLRPEAKIELIREG